MRGRLALVREGDDETGPAPRLAFDRHVSPVQASKLPDQRQADTGASPRTAGDSLRSTAEPFEDLVPEFVGDPRTRIGHHDPQ